jgi:hypothetical protein
MGDDMPDIFSWMDCGGCPYYRFHRGRTGGDPDTCCPDEAECLDGDFGSNHPCDRMISRIEEGLRDGDFAFSLSYLVNSWCLTDPETKDDYWDVLAAWPDIDWSEHPYWQIFYGTESPAGFDTAEEVYEEVFQ